MTSVAVGDADVIVVGGGPAGAATAIWCARHELRVALIERARFPRHRPGETLAPGIEPLFRQLGVADAVGQAGFLRHPGTWVTWSGERRFNAYGSGAGGAWLGFQAPRDRLDAILLDAAVNAGATVLQPTHGVRPVVNNGRVAGVATAAERFGATWVVDAAGGQHWLARRLDIARRCASPRLTAHYGYVRGSGPANDGIPEIVADADGWTWTAPIDRDLQHWTRLSWTDGDSWRNHLPAHVEGLQPYGRPRGADVTWRIVTRPAGPGYICVGDAAAVLDPASSHGVLKAVMSGMMAGHVITANLLGGTSRAAAIGAYTDWLAGHFAADVTALTDLYRSLPTPPRWVLRKRQNGQSTFESLHQ